MDITIHNDVGNFSIRHGYFLILLENSISGISFYLGIQTNANWRGKAVIFSRWGIRDLGYAKFAEDVGWPESAGHEGDFIGVRRSYDWGVGDYRARIAPDGLEEDEEWFSLWVTDLESNEETWIGSLKFPLEQGTARMQPRALATIEIYGFPIRPVDIPVWHVSVGRPRGDGVPATWGFTSYPYDDSENALFNSDVRYEATEERAHLVTGGTTKRENPPQHFDFTSSEALEGAEITGKVLGPKGEPLRGIGLWAWQGEESNSSYGMTDKDGKFSIRAPEGSFTLDIYPSEGCSFVGWYDGDGSLATTRKEAATLEAGTEGLDEIEIRLPENPDDLPRIEWCS